MARYGSAHPDSRRPRALIPIVVPLLLASSLLLAQLASKGAAAAEESGLDSAGDGRVTTDFGGGVDLAYGVALQPDGKIVAAGNTRSSAIGDFDFALVRYNRDGSLDQSFSGDGRVTTDFGGGVDLAYGVALQPDGKIVAAGGSRLEFALVRYHRDGSLDQSFGGDGRVTTDFGDVDEAHGVALQPNGKIVAAGGTSLDFALARYNRDGSLDQSFGGDGSVTTDFGDVMGGFDEAFGVALRPDGRIVAAGRASFDFGVARYNPDGSLDQSFGGDGTVTTDFGIPGGDVAFGVALQPDGRIIAAGDSSGDFGVARYNRDGSPDQSFGGDGRVTTGFSGGDWAYAVALQPDGKIVAAGWSTTAEVVFALVRYNRDGSLDQSFGDDGRVTTDFGGFEVGHGVALQPDGKVVAAGYTLRFGFGYDFALTRYNRDGSLDQSFGAEGR